MVKVKATATATSSAQTRVANPRVSQVCTVNDCGIFHVVKVINNKIYWQHYTCQTKQRQIEKILQRVGH